MNSMELGTISLDYISVFSRDLLFTNWLLLLKSYLLNIHMNILLPTTLNRIGHKQSVIRGNGISICRDCNDHIIGSAKFRGRSN